jgi:uncharacterized protein (TIGR02302 family)
MKRLAAAFDWQGVMLPANFRIDAWVSPPAYTGRPPLILPGLHPGEPVRTATSEVSVPAGSLLVIRASGIALDVVTTGGLAEAPKGAQSTSANGSEERRFLINEAGGATVRGTFRRDVGWQFTAIPDHAPTIALTEDPEGQARGAMKLSYKVEDDYGVVSAQASFSLAGQEGTNGQPPRGLYEAPNFPLVLPQARTRNGSGQTTKDLTEHPWAGADVAMTLSARDEVSCVGGGCRRAGCPCLAPAVGGSWRSLANREIHCALCPGSNGRPSCFSAVLSANRSRPRLSAIPRPLSDDDQPLKSSLCSGR